MRSFGKAAIVLLAVLFIAAPALANQIYLVEKAKIRFSDDISAVEKVLTQDEKASESRTQIRAALEMGFSGSRGYIRELQEIISESDNENVTIAAAFALLKIGEYEGVDTVIKLTQSNHSQYVKATVKSLYIQRIQSMS